MASHIAGTYGHIQCHLSNRTEEEHNLIGSTAPVARTPRSTMNAGCYGGRIQLFRQNSMRRAQAETVLLPSTGQPRPVMPRGDTSAYTTTEKVEIPAASFSQCKHSEEKTPAVTWCYSESSCRVGECDIFPRWVSLNMFNIISPVLVTPSLTLQTAKNFQRIISFNSGKGL